MVNLSKIFFFVVFFFVFIPTISAVCEDGQININSASLEELDELTGIGPAYAGRIVENRPFNSVEDLIKVSGIGEITLANIKAQGLACVNEETINKSEKEVEIIEEEILEELEFADSQVGEIVEIVEKSEIILDKKVEIISLNSKVADEKDDLVYVSKNAQVVDYLPYGFAIFLIFVIGFLIWERF